MNLLRAILVLLPWLDINAAFAVGEWSGNISLEPRLFPEATLHQGQERQNVSLAVNPEYYLDWDGDKQRIVFHPFFRYDSSDDERTQADMRELYWRGSYDDFEITAGIAKVFWGVAESRHLVDIINQTDFIENIDEEDKLGQPMVKLRFVKDWGTVDLYLLPWFRERTFPGVEGRLRTALVVDTDHPEFESGAEESHTDWAVRWSHYIGNWDIGIAHFSGTSREPLLFPQQVKGEVVLTPYYGQLEQTSLDLQATLEDWLWKLELVSREIDDERYTAFVGGFEYTRVGIFKTATDVGFLLEYHFDDRHDRAQNVFQNDIFAGLRWVLNDVQSTEVLAGVIVDADTQSTFANIEASRRFGRAWKMTFEARVFDHIPMDDLLYDLRRDDYVELQLARYF